MRSIRYLNVQGIGQHRRNGKVLLIVVSLIQELNTDQPYTGTSPHHYDQTALPVSQSELYTIGSCII